MAYSCKSRNEHQREIAHNTYHPNRLKDRKEILISELVEHWQSSNWRCLKNVNINLLVCLLGVVTQLNP